MIELDSIVTVVAPLGVFTQTKLDTHAYEEWLEWYPDQEVRRAVFYLVRDNPSCSFMFPLMTSFYLKSARDHELPTKEEIESLHTKIISVSHQVIILPFVGWETDPAVQVCQELAEVFGVDVTVADANALPYTKYAKRKSTDG